MLNTVYGVYSTGVSAYSNSRLESKSVSALNSDLTKAIQSHDFYKSDSLESQSVNPVQFPSSINSNKMDSFSNKRSENDDLQNKNIFESSDLQSEQASQEQQVQDVIRQLKARDTEVRAHEMAHLAVAGSYARGGMSFTYQTGPDGNKYAIGGEVGIDTSPVSGDPEATLLKAMIIQRAAMAPAEPSTQDHKVAQMAMQMMNQARVEISAQSSSKNQNIPNGESEQSMLLDFHKTVRENDEYNQITFKGKAEKTLDLATQARQQFNLRLQLPLAESIYK